MGLRIILRNGDDFAAKTEFGIVLESFRGIEVGLRIALSEEKREEKLDFDFFVQKCEEKGSWTKNNLSK